MTDDEADYALVLASRWPPENREPAYSLTNTGNRIHQYPRRVDRWDSKFLDCDLIGRVSPSTLNGSS
jgi:hypothetical protein